MRRKFIWRWCGFFVNWHPLQLGLGLVLNWEDSQRGSPASGVGISIGPLTVGYLFTDKEVDP